MHRPQTSFWSLCRFPPTGSQGLQSPWPNVGGAGLEVEGSRGRGVPPQLGDKLLCCPPLSWLGGALAAARVCFQKDKQIEEQLKRASRLKVRFGEMHTLRPHFHGSQTVLFHNSGVTRSSRYPNPDPGVSSLIGGSGQAHQAG